MKEGRRKEVRNDEPKRIYASYFQHKNCFDLGSCGWRRTERSLHEAVLIDERTFDKEHEETDLRCDSSNDDLCEDLDSLA